MAKASNRTRAADGWSRCPACAEILPTSEITDRQQVCPSCNYHYPLPLAERMALLLDEGSFEPLGASLITTDLLGFKGARKYRSQLARARKATGSDESVQAGTARLEGRSVAAAFVDGGFLAGSLGCVALERLCQVFDRASKERPAVVVTQGAQLRHAEGAVGMSQLARLSEARRALAERGGLYLSVIVAPLPTGAACSYAYSGDVNLAEPGVADPDQAEETDPPPAGDALAGSGLVDRVVDRGALRSELSALLGLLG